MILLIDNFDSFTFNLYDYLKQSGADVMVKRNNEITIQQISQLSPSAIVISPGPGKPEDAGITMNIIDQFQQKIPILGICLGYQAIGVYYGAELIKSPVPVHGKTSEIIHDNDDVFKNIPQQTEVMRYHSLNITNIPPCINLIAKTFIHNEPMALKHVTLPLYGFQFHPESILTTHGKQILNNWLSLS